MRMLGGILGLICGVYGLVPAWIAVGCMLGCMWESESNHHGTSDGAVSGCTDPRVVEGA